MKIYLATLYLLEDMDNSSCEKDVGVFTSHDKAVEAAVKACAKANGNASRYFYDYWIRSFEVQ